MASSVVLAIAAKKGIETIVENYVAPKLERLASLLSLEVKDMLVPHREHFREYLERIYTKHETLNTIVRCNSQLKLKDIYVPLTIVEEESDGKIKAETINGYPQKLLNKYGKILIQDTAGMGKSTITKRIFIDIVENGYGIPIYIELRRLSANKKLLEEIIEQLGSLRKSFDNELLLKLIENGEFIFILDGYDEINLADREIVTKDIQEFIFKTSVGNKFILSSRPESALTSFGQFKSFGIQPLSRDEAYQLIRNYDEDGKNAELLIKQLNSGKYGMIDEFLKNPLLVSLLYTAFDYRQMIPLKKHVFYRQVFDAYFKAHDLTKGDSYVHQKKTMLVEDEFNKVLRMMGFLSLLQSKVEFTKDEVLKLIETSKGYCSGLNFHSSDMLHDLLNTVPLFVQDGNYYKWSHKSLQEYFAAEYIYLDAKERQGEILCKMYKSDHIESFCNLFDLYFDIDTEGFKQHILRDFVSGYLEYREKTILPNSNSEINEDLYDQRLYIMYCLDIALFRSANGKKRPTEESESVNAVRRYVYDNHIPFNWYICCGITKQRDVDFVILNARNIVDFAEVVYNHMPDLFHITPNPLNRFRRKMEDLSFDEIQAGVIHPITICTCDDDIKKYRLINQYGLRRCGDIYPNIARFTEEIRNIDNSIQTRKEMDFLNML